jgi:RNA polymerase sigma-70 factor (ECF subfamily)
LVYLQNSEDAEEVTQDVFVSVYQSIDQFNHTSTLKTWIYKITINKCLDFLKAKKTKKRWAFVSSIFNNGGGLKHDTSDFVHPGIILENKERSIYLFKAIEELPENQRIAFTLNKIECLSYQEVSEITGMSVSAVESLLFRAKQNLKKILMDYYEENEIQ